MSGEQDLIQRIERLETANRRMKLAGLGAVLIVGAALVMGQAAGQPEWPNTVEAKRFVLIDDGGQRRGIWEARPDGLAVLAVCDKDERPRATWTVSPDGSTVLFLADEHGTKRGAWTVLSDGDTAMSLCSEDGKARVTWLVDSEGSTALMLNDKRGTMRGAWYISPDGGTSLMLNDRHGTTRATLGRAQLQPAGAEAIEVTAESSLVFFDKDGKVLTQLP